MLAKGGPFYKHDLTWVNPSVRRYFDPHDILTPLTIFWPPYNNQVLFSFYIYLIRYIIELASY